MLVNKALITDSDVSSFVSNAIKEIQNEVKDGKVLLALSGGLDSTVLSSLLTRAIGERLTCVFLDTGLMRKGEGNEIKNRFSDRSCKFIHIDAKKRFLNALKGVIDPEEKRRVIGECFIKVFEERAGEIDDIEFLAQGTIYADILESGKGKDGKLVKSHHNVGGLPSIINFKSLIEPFKLLLKEDVRKVGAYLGLPPSILYRQPFPGPGLAIRILGEVTEEKLDILRDADAIWRGEVEEFIASNAKDEGSSGSMQSIDQYFAILTDMKTVGVKNGERTYGYTLALRAVITKDFINACPKHFSPEFYDDVSTKILNEVPFITRVVYDITAKPPSTIEWE